jgi:Tol biopolymer transport system component
MAVGLAGLPGSGASAAVVLPLVVAPAVTSTAAGGLDMFYRDSANAVRYQRFRGGAWQAATSLGGSWATGPGAAGDPVSKKVLVAATKTDKTVWTRSMSATGTWTAWTSIGGVTNGTGQPAVASLGGGAFAVVIRGAGNAAFARFFRNNRWGAWTSLGGVLSAPPAAAGISGGTLLVAAVGTDTATSIKTVSSTGVQSTWSSVGGATVATPALAVDPVSGARNLFLRNTSDGTLWQRVFTPATGTWGGWSSLGGTLRSGPAAVSWGPGRLDVVSYDANLVLQQNSANQGTWYGFHPITLGGTVPVIATTSLSAGLTGVPYSAQLTTTDGRAGTWTVASGAMPAGVSMSSTGVISGTPTTIGTGSFTVRFTDTVARASTRALTLAVAQGITLASVATNGGYGNGDSSGSAISSDGRYVAFVSGATDLVLGDTNGLADVFVRDRQAGVTTRVSEGNGVQPNGGSQDPKISGDGRYVVFVSTASNLVPGDTNGSADVFLRDRLAGVTTRVTVAATGAQANGASSVPVISADGRHVAFASAASNLATGSTGGGLFVKALELGTVTRIPGGFDDGTSPPSISGTGRYVAFVSPDSNLVPNDTNGVRDVFVRDLQNGTTTRASAQPNGTQTEFPAFHPAISADGRFVAFGFQGSEWGSTIAVSSILVRNLQTGSIRYVEYFGCREQRLPSLSADGRYLTWATSEQGPCGIHFADLQTNTVQEVPVRPDGEWSGASAYAPSISADGRFVTFTANKSDLLPGDTAPEWPDWLDAVYVSQRR